MKILVLKRDKIGDLLLATPMLRHLRESLPSAEIHLLASESNAWVVDGNRNIDRVWVCRRAAARIPDFVGMFDQLRNIVRLRMARFDAAIVAAGEESVRALRRGLAVRAKRTIGYCAADRWKRSLTDPLAVPAVQHEIERMTSLLVPLGIALPGRPIYPEYLLPPAQGISSRLWLSERRLEEGRFVVIGLGARRQQRQPSKEQVIRWASHFRHSFGLDTVLMWTPGRSDAKGYPGDDVLAQSVLAEKRSWIHGFRGPVKPAIGLIWQARCSIFPDSGLMHFAAASPGGVLGLFSGSDASPNPGQWGPRGPCADYLETKNSVSELPDGLVYSRLAARLY